MEITFSKKMDLFKVGVFSELSAYKKQKIAEGQEIIDLSIGSPDLPPPEFITYELSKQVKDPTKYGYSLSGISRFNETVSQFYQKKYHVELSPAEEVLLLMGTQDGLVHLPMVLANPGDIILVPDPGYTAYAAGISMADAIPYFMPLEENNKYLPDLTAIPENIAQKAKLMILNYPGNPVPALASKEFFERVLKFARKHQIIVVHDFAYSELYYSSQKPISFLSIPGAKEVGVEFNSLSKSFNMAGCRIGYLTGNKEIIGALNLLKSNLDYGVFMPIQEAAIAALLDESDYNERTREIYQKRRDVLVEGLNELGWAVTKPKASMFIWAKVPNGFTSSSFAYELINKSGVVVTPGNAFGENGEGYVRIALVQDEKTLTVALNKIKKSGIF